MSEKKPEKKIKPHTNCKNGHHVFIVSNWRTTASQKKAMHLLCQHCLMPVDLVEIENAKWFDK